MTASQPQLQVPLAERYYSREEAAEAIAKLDAKGKATLRKLARSYWEERMSGPSAASEPDDLLQEAVFRTVRGTRRWRRSVTIIKHLIRTMESVSWEAHRARLAQPHGWAEDGVERTDPADRRAGPGESIVIDTVLAREELAQVERLFNDDQEALEVLRYRSRAFSPSETCERLGMEKSRYDTVNKRIWRKLTKSAKNNQDEGEQ